MLRRLRIFMRKWPRYAELPMLCRCETHCERSHCRGQLQQNLADHAMAAAENAAFDKDLVFRSEVCQLLSSHQSGDAEL